MVEIHAYAQRVLACCISSRSRRAVEVSCRLSLLVPVDLSSQCTHDRDPCTATEV